MSPGHVRESFLFVGILLLGSLDRATQWLAYRASTGYDPSSRSLRDRKEKEQEKGITKKGGRTTKKKQGRTTKTGSPKKKGGRTTKKKQGRTTKKGSPKRNWDHRKSLFSLATNRSLANKQKSPLANKQKSPLAGR